ncbi:hypothetical protein K4K59_001204 [Colletotrichum sp. SAR11_240]|nr:hypothetical protein K4K59_001204 [Colletotrichum sp. SAR11_240]
MLPSLNPTAPAFSPPVSIPQLASPFISTSGAASDSDPDLLGLDLDLDLDSELDGPLSPSSEAGRVASALIGESLFKAVFEAPSSPYSPVVDADDDDYFTQLPSSPQTTSSTPSSGRDIWSPTSAFRSTSEVNSPFSSVASLADKETWCAGELPSSPAEAEMAWGEDWAHDDDVYLGQGSSPEPFSAMPAPAEASLKVAPAAMPSGSLIDDHRINVAGPAYRDQPNEEESASGNPASTISVESDDSTGGTESFLHLTPTPTRNIADSSTSREISPGRSISDGLDLNATPGSLLEDPSGGDPMLENSPNDAVETPVSVFVDTLLDFGLVCGRRIGLFEGTKILVETRMMDLRAEMDKAWSSIKEGRNCERGFDAIESDLKLLAETKSNVDGAGKDAENEFQTYRLAFIDIVQAASRHLAQV